MRPRTASPLVTRRAPISFARSQSAALLILASGRIVATSVPLRLRMLSTDTVSLIESAWLCQSTSPPQLEACGHLAHEIHLVAFGSALRRLGLISVPHWAHTP